VKIAVVGSGNMGGALGRLFAGAGHAVAFSYLRDAAKLRRLARASSSGARAASSPADAVSDSDIVLLADRVPECL
jgi:predicted dinucleotide-binding enzyme